MASAQWGKHYGKRTTYGHSMIVDPWGEIKDVLPTGNGVVSTEINLELIAETRARFPALSHRKIETNG
jgi:nitrilase